MAVPIHGWGWLVACGEVLWQSKEDKGLGARGVKPVCWGHVPLLL